MTCTIGSNQATEVALDRDETHSAGIVLMAAGSREPQASYASPDDMDEDFDDDFDEDFDDDFEDDDFDDLDDDDDDLDDDDDDDDFDDDDEFE